MKNKEMIPIKSKTKALIDAKNNLSEEGIVLIDDKGNVQIRYNMEDISDGYHDFKSLYEQRAVLFAVIVNSHPDISFKSFKHSDGKYCFDSNGEWFIVGIKTPVGYYTYHYEKKYFDLFRCKEVKMAPEWDGHTDKDVTRLLTIME